MKLIYLLFFCFFIFGCSGCLNDEVKPDVVQLIDPDSDCDGVIDSLDVCPGINDLTDSDNNGLPDCKYPPATYAQVAPHWKCGTPSQQKVKVCYKTPSGGFQTVCTYYSAIHTHIRNGGFLGVCGESSCNN